MSSSFDSAISDTNNFSSNNINEDNVLSSERESKNSGTSSNGSLILPTIIMDKEGDSMESEQGQVGLVNRKGRRGHLLVNRRLEDSDSDEGISSSLVTNFHV